MNANPSKITAACSPVGGPGAVPQQCVAAPDRFIPCDPSEGYGRHGRCTDCGHGRYSCICDVPDIDVPPVSDMKRIMPRLFDEDSGWALAERSAYGMPGTR